MLTTSVLFKMLLLTSILSQVVHCQRLGRSRRETSKPLSTDVRVPASIGTNEDVKPVGGSADELLRPAASTRTQRSYYGGGSSERLFDLGLLSRPGYYSGNRGYYPSGGYYPQSGYYPQGGYLPQGGYYPSGGYGGAGYYPGTNTLGVGSTTYGGGVYGGYGGYGGFGGNGGLQSYYGYNNDNYYGNRNLGYGYYTGTSPSGYVGSTLVSGFRGYN
ncbi:prisilkin-39-like [Anopheles marshallii]|uniref:prisilkin-39-like n=1 Tax=Anopheles marshallii TaxID=1521116 RepID=UPI00237B7215|nr:prisilkin-39-like [Anopheles marshallii]